MHNVHCLESKLADSFTVSKRSAYQKASGRKIQGDC